MSLQNEQIFASNKILDFYSQHAQKFGNSSKGVGWKNDEAQKIRFEQLVKIIGYQHAFSLNDLGCGTGEFYKYLLQRNFQPSAYWGYDLLEDMITLAKENLLPNPAVSLHQIRNASEMHVADYSVASGIFNVKYDANDETWLSHVISTLEWMDNKSKFGFAFNMLTKYSDPEFMQSYLYYADPTFFFELCKVKFSKNVALLHDYFQYDFTILVRKQA